jgi:hypothetical protein
MLGAFALNKQRWRLIQFAKRVPVPTLQDEGRMRVAYIRRPGKNGYDRDC